MHTIRDLPTHDLSESMEEVIKLDQHNEQNVYNEITEYVATECRAYDASGGAGSCERRSGGVSR